MKKIFSTFLVLCIATALNGQAFNIDSAFQIVLEEMPLELRDALKSKFDSATDEDKVFMVLFLSMPTSSKQELINNIDTCLPRILVVKKQYSELIPKGIIVRIEFNEEDRLQRSRENIDLKIVSKNGSENKKILFREWNLEYNSPLLDSVLRTINWNLEKLLEVKQMLKSIHCISIENGKPTTFGFAFSGMGLYSFKIFDNDLNSDQIKEYNDGCTFIFYKNNIVLEYGGGAIGPQCFPDE